jgi:hypothetical protein
MCPMDSPRRSAGRTLPVSSLARTRDDSVVSISKTTHSSAPDNPSQTSTVMATQRISTLVSAVST